MKAIARQMSRTCNKLFSRKRPNDQALADMSTVETAAPMEVTQRPPAPPGSPGATGRGSGLLSAIVGVNVLILGCALVGGSVLNNVAVTAVHRQVFLMVLLLLTVAWMLLYAGVTSPRHPEGPVTDSQAGPVWLRAGLLLFGFLSLLMDIFKVSYYVGYLHCDSAVKVAFPVVQALFVFIQTHFLWRHAKDCVQLHTSLTRCGLMVALSTNLLLWVAAVAEESIHQTEVPLLNISSKTYRATDGNKTCACSHSACNAFKEAFFYLYPFNIEYSIFASALLFVMWRNVGRPVEARGRRRPKFRPRDVCLGPVAGVLVVLAGLVVFIMYEVLVLQEEGGGESRDAALTTYFLANVAIAGLMVLSALLGCVAHRLDRRGRVSGRNPTRSLDVGLLVGASVGQLVVSYCSAVAAVAAGAGERLNALDLSWAALTVLQLGLQNYFVIEGLHREPFGVLQGAALRADAVGEQGGGGEDVEGGKPRSLVPAPDDQPDWKRRVQKEVCAFLLLCNIILWIMPAFGARPQFDHPLETKFYRFTMWAAIVNIGLPFGIFYRMHSVASLFEVYLIT